MVALDEFWPRSIGAIRSITTEIVAAIFVSAFLTSLVIALRVSVACTTLSRWRALADHFVDFGRAYGFDRLDHCDPHKANAYADRAKA